MNLDFHPQSVSVSFTVEGSSSVSVMGYVHDVDMNTLMAIRNQLGESAFQSDRGAQKTLSGDSDGNKNEKLTTEYTENPLPDMSFKPFDVKV